MKLKLKSTGIAPKDIYGNPLLNAIISDYNIVVFNNQFMKLSIALYASDNTSSPSVNTRDWFITKNPISPTYKKDINGADTLEVLATGHPGMQTFLIGMTIGVEGIVINNQSIKDWILAQLDFEGNILSDNWEFQI